MANSEVSRDFTRRRVRPVEAIYEGLLFAAAAMSVLITVGIVYVLGDGAVHFFSKVPILTFLTDTQWAPLYEQNARFGIAPLLCGTLLSTMIALAVAIPVGLMVSIYLSEFASYAAREIIKPILELLAGVPTVIFGYFALTFVTPLLQAFVPGIGGGHLPGFNILSAGLVIGVLIIPYIASISEDAMRAVPNGLREGSYAMGATKLETAFSVVLPAATSGVVGAFVLGMSRAVGETMVVAIAGGQRPVLSLDPRQPMSTITAYMAQVARGDLEFGSIGYYSIFAAGLALLVLTLVFNLIAFALNRAFREVY